MLRGRHGELPVRVSVAPHGPGPGRHAVCRVLPVLPAPPPTGHPGHTGHAPLGVDINYQLVRGQCTRARVRLAALTRTLTEFTCSLTFDRGLLHYLESTQLSLTLFCQQIKILTKDEEARVQT